MTQGLNLLNVYLMPVLMDAGLQGLYKSLVKNWLAPVFLIIVAVSAFMFIRSQQWTKLIGFVAIAAIVGALIFFGDSLFGANGVLSGMFTSAGKAVGHANQGEGAFSGQ